MTTEERDSGRLEILDKAAAVLAALDLDSDLSVPQIAGQVDEPVSSTYRLLSNLQSIGWVEPGSKRGRFRLGLYFLRIGGQLEERLSIREAALPALKQLWSDTGATTFLCIQRGSRAVCVERFEGRNVRSIELQLGDSLPLHHGAASLAILGFLPKGERDSLIDDLAEHDHALASSRGRAAFEQTIRETRELGYAVSDGDVTPGIAALGAPVFNHRGELAAAISISDLQTSIIPSMTDLSAQVMIAAGVASRALGFESAKTTRFGRRDPHVSHY